MRDNYNMLLTLQLEPFPPKTPKHFVHGEVPIQLQGLWEIDKVAYIKKIYKSIKIKGSQNNYNFFLYFVWHQFQMT